MLGKAFSEEESEVRSGEKPFRKREQLMQSLGDEAASAAYGEQRVTTRVRVAGRVGGTEPAAVKPGQISSGQQIDEGSWVSC